MNKIAKSFTSTTRLVDSNIRNARSAAKLSHLANNHTIRNTWSYTIILMCHFLDGRLKSLTFFPIRLCVMIIVIRRGKVLLFITSKSIWAISTCAAAAATATGGGTASILPSLPYSHYWKSTSKTEYTQTVFRNIKRLFHYTVTLFCIEFSVFLHCFFFIWKVLPVIFLLGCWNVASGLYQIEYRLFLKNREKKWKMNWKNEMV